MLCRPLLILLLLWLSAPVAPPGAQALPRQRCFQPTGFCVADPMLAYWERQGGLPIFGYPISESRFETVEGRTLEVQWFERDRLEIQADGRVTAGRLGARWLELQGHPWETFPRVARAGPGCHYIAITGHQLCEPFLGYWRTSGGLARFGYPITEPHFELIEGKTYQVQYFERRRMEYHPELAGARNAILLGLLGQALAETDSCVALDPAFEPTAYAYRQLLGCPIYASRELVGNKRLGGLREVPLAIQRFERGMLLWFQPLGFGSSPAGNIVAVGFDPDRQAQTWRQYQDTWREGESTGVAEQPPPGLHAPIHGFGKLWSTNPDVRQLLGWATEPEHGETGNYRAFRKGFVIYRPATDRCYLFTEDGIAREVPLQRQT
jgi:hypothetical protein